MNKTYSCSDVRIRVEELNAHFYAAGSRAPYPPLFCDRCGDIDKWQPLGTQFNNSREVQVWQCACGRQTETGTTL